MASSSSSVVASVQELIKEAVINIPKGYVRVDVEKRDELIETSLTIDIPTIDMKLLTMDQSLKNPEVQKLHLACKDSGIFQLVNYGIDLAFMEKVNYEIEAFFNLPLEEKRKYEAKEGEFEGYGNKLKVGGKLDWGDRFFMSVNPKSRVKPDLFPKLPSSMRDTLQSFKDEWEKLAMQLLEIMSMCLGLDIVHMKDFFNDGYQSMRMAYYPPCPQPELVIGLTPHTDVTAITFLHQVNGVDGFQIKKDGVWRLIHVLPNAILINLGDIFEILTNSYYKSVEHRVTVNSMKERISIAMAFNPNMEMEIGPLPSLTNAENPPLFKTIKMADYIDGFFSHKLYGRSYFEEMSNK